MKKAEAHFQRGEKLHENGRFLEAHKEWRAAAALGHGGAMFNLGAVYNEGLGVETNVATGHDWLQRSAATGNADGLGDLAIHFRFGAPGAGVAPNQAEAMRLIRKAAATGHLRSMHNLGLWLTEDDINDPEQLVWFNRGAEQGCDRAMNSLGACYSDGRGGLEVDQVTGFAWYLKAVEKGGNSDAMYNVGRAYEHGSGVAQNLAMAAEWYKRASKAGDKDAPMALLRVTLALFAVGVSSASTASSAATDKKSTPCSACGEPADNHCSGCLDEKYCSVDCQRAHWQEHKAECKEKQAKLKEQKK